MILKIPETLFLFCCKYLSFLLDTLVYANNIKKTNSWGMSQVRLIAITNNAIYNIHGKKIKRSIMIKDISGITKTVHPKN